jgi:hypothetical protein
MSDYICYLFVFVRGVAMAGAHLVEDWAEQTRREEANEGRQTVGYLVGPSCPIYSLKI